MIHITEKTALKSDSDRSLRSYYGNLKDRINSANIDITELTKNINSTLDMIDYMAERLEDDRQELIEYVEEERAFLPEKGKESLNGTLDTISEVLEGSDIKDIRDEIENESKCLTACQACFTATYSTCVSGDSPFCNYTTCNVCVSTQTGCQFCDSDQNTCAVEDVPCDYTSPCTPCYSQLYNTCKQEQISCNYSAGCTDCQGNVSTCSNCQGTVGTCGSCYGGSFGTCGEGQTSTCTMTHTSCSGGQQVTCSSNNTCDTGDKDCNRNVSCWVNNSTVCKSGYKKGPPEICELGFKDDTVECGSGYNEKTCSTNFHSTGNVDIDCESGFGAEEGGHTSCTAGFQQDCHTSYDSASCTSRFYVDDNGNQHCDSGYPDCTSYYVTCGLGNEGCVGGQPGCPVCYGTSYGCSGCYDVEYCSKCNTSQTTCNTCVSGQTTCETCVKGEEGHQEDVCNSCYAGCQSVWEDAKECLSTQTGMPIPGGCTICVSCQVVHGGTCSSCYVTCYGNDCSTGDSWCGSANCGAANCSSANCGTSNCSVGQCNQAGCDTCDDVSACICSHTGNYQAGCGFSSCCFSVMH